MSASDSLIDNDLSKSVQGSCDISPETPSIQELECILHSGKGDMNHVDEVWPNLFLGNMCMAHDRHGLWKLGITHVLNVNHGKTHSQGSHDFYGKTVDYHGVPADDVPNFDMSPYFRPSADYIHEALNTPGAKVFIHCAFGVSRSASLVLAYLMIHHHFTLLDAIRKVKENSHCFSITLQASVATVASGPQAQGYMAHRIARKPGETGENPESKTTLGYQIVISDF
ncbi:dual specificity protein phosphatase 13A-like isoform X1 [Conger conger]|uniref:dual specificity protein phosphatase 13A-like isoform X1 n=1 Tax=Conger conger TaxID=82655 RepID=UPI002A5A4EEF|nr:dual specificity protein phosphatase 13A-like isoform X1 [Conger conger]